jgi:hypothetical protein
VYIVTAYSPIAEAEREAIGAWFDSAPIFSALQKFLAEQKKQYKKLTNQKRLSNNQTHETKGVKP